MGTEIVNWEEKLAAEAKAVAALERPSVSGISLRGGVMMLNDIQVPKNTLDCVIVGSVFEHAYFSKPFDPNNIVNPDCFSLSPHGVDMVPDPAVPNPPNGQCDTCPMFAWGSDPKPGSRGKACKEKRKIALLPAASVKDGEIMKAEMALMTISVTNVRHWGNYVNTVAAEYGRPPWAVLTRIEVVPHVKNQFQINFTCAGVVADAYLGDLSKRASMALEALMQPYDMTPQPEVPEKQAPAKDSKKKY